MSATDVIGILGVIAYLGAYFGLQMNLMQSRSKVYLGLNILGSVAAMISLLASWNLPSFISSVCWLLISAYSMAKTTVREAVRDDHIDTSIGFTGYKGAS